MKTKKTKVGQELIKATKAAAKHEKARTNVAGHLKPWNSFKALCGFLFSDKLPMEKVGGETKSKKCEQCLKHQKEL